MAPALLRRLVVKRTSLTLDARITRLARERSRCSESDQLAC